MKTYYLLIPVPRQAILAIAKACNAVRYAVSGGTTTEDLNWLRELPASEGWHQRLAGEDRERTVVMDVTRDPQ